MLLDTVLQYGDGSPTLTIQRNQFGLLNAWVVLRTGTGGEGEEKYEGIGQTVGEALEDLTRVMERGLGGLVRGGGE